MPEISRFYGIKIRMFYEDHNPPHFHMEYQEYEAIVHIKDGSFKGEMPKRAVKLVLEWSDAHQSELLDNWRSMMEKGEFKKIKPLI